MEERRNIRRAFFFVVLAVAVFVVFSFWGVPSLVKFSNVLMGVKKGQIVSNKNDNIPPPPPRFNDFPSFTNQTKIELTGSSEPDSTIKLTLNNQELETTVDLEGKFTFQLALNKGENTFYAFALDASGNKSTTTQAQKITFDNQPPDLTISSPSDGASFFGSNQKNISIQGTTEAGVALTINDRIISVKDDGSFSFSTILSDGDNQFSIKATDKAGNTTEKDIKVTFSP